MKFVYFGYDFMLDTVRRLLRDGHELCGIFTFECDNLFNFNTETVKLGLSLKIPVSQNKVDVEAIDKMIALGAECFFAAGYPYKIPPINESKAYGVNLHPSLLPKGRGLMPTPTIIMHAPEAAGLTVHKLSSVIDQGDILDQVPLKLSERETVESYSARIALAAPDVMGKVFEDIGEYWMLSKPQDESEAVTFPVPDDAMRMIDWHDDITMLDKKARAFGRYGCLARIEGQLWVIYDHDVWQENHVQTYGRCVMEQPRHMVIAAKNGYFVIKDAARLE